MASIAFEPPRRLTGKEEVLLARFATAVDEALTDKQAGLVGQSAWQYKQARQCLREAAKQWIGLDLSPLETEEGSEMYQVHIVRCEMPNCGISYSSPTPGMPGTWRRIRGKVYCTHCAAHLLEVIEQTGGDAALSKAFEEPAAEHASP